MSKKTNFYIDKCKNVSDDIKKWYRESNGQYTTALIRTIRDNIKEYDKKGIIKKFNDVCDIAVEFCKITCHTCPVILNFPKYMYMDDMRIHEDPVYYCACNDHIVCKSCHGTWVDPPYCIKCRPVSYLDTQEQLKKMKEKIEELETHIKYMPQGQGYEEAKNNFENTINEPPVLS